MTHQTHQILQARERGSEGIIRGWMNIPLTPQEKQLDSKVLIEQYRAEYPHLEFRFNQTGSRD